MADKKPIQHALIPDEATPATLVDLLPKAQQILKASAQYLTEVRKFLSNKTKQDHLKEWGEIDALTEVLYDTAARSQKTLDAGLAIETMLTKPLSSHEIILLDDLRNAIDNIEEGTNAEGD